MIPLDGQALARRLNQELARQVPALPRPPGLAVVLVGEDPASRVYVSRKGTVAHRLGFVHRQVDLAADTSLPDLLRVVDALNTDPTIDGILVQLPLPAHLDAAAVADRIDPRKDVDGLTATNAGLLVQGRVGHVPCTPLGVMALLAEAGVTLRGARAVVVGRSNIVGRPMAQLLEHADCTVTLAHSRTRDVAALVRSAEIVVAAVGRPEFVAADWIAPGAVVVDVGINRLPDGLLVGDVVGAGLDHAAFVTPVPGGVGPMTIAMLMQNTFRAATA